MNTNAFYSNSFAVHYTFVHFGHKVSLLKPGNTEQFGHSCLDSLRWSVCYM